MRGSLLWRDVRSWNQSTRRRRTHRHGGSIDLGEKPCDLIFSGLKFLRRKSLRLQSTLQSEQSLQTYSQRVVVDIA